MIDDRRADESGEWCHSLHLVMEGGTLETGRLCMMLRFWRRGGRGWKKNVAHFSTSSSPSFWPAWLAFRATTFATCRGLRRDDDGRWWWWWWWYSATVVMGANSWTALNKCVSVMMMWKRGIPFFQIHFQSVGFPIPHSKTFLGLSVCQWADK